MYIAQIFQHTFSTEMILIVVHILKKFPDKWKKDNQLFVIFVVFKVKQSVGKTEKISEFRSFQDLFIRLDYIRIEILDYLVVYIILLIYWDELLLEYIVHLNNRFYQENTINIYFIYLKDYIQFLSFIFVPNRIENWFHLVIYLYGVIL